MLDTFVQICDGLAHESPPLAIDHADIHGANALVDRTGPRLVDWGDSCIGHPFSSLLAPVEWVAGRLPPGDRRRALNRLIDAYLEPWARDGDRAVLALATWVAYVARAISNDEQASGGSQDEIAQAHAEIVALLRTWFHKRAVLDSPEELLGPAMPW